LLVNNYHNVEPFTHGADALNDASNNAFCSILHAKAIAGLVQISGRIPDVTSRVKLPIGEKDKISVVDHTDRLTRDVGYPEGDGFVIGAARVHAGFMSDSLVSVLVSVRFTF
jgi:hypothetical protein